MTSPAELERWLRGLFADATVESGRVDRVSDFSVERVVLDELDEYYLFRIECLRLPRIQVGVTLEALDCTPLEELKDRLRLAIQLATAGTGDPDDRFIVTSVDLIARERSKRDRP